MMNENLETIDSVDNGNLTINNQMKQDLLVASNWGKFLSIVGFIGIGFMIIGALGMFAVSSNVPRSMSGFNPSIFAIIYLAMAILYFFPVYYLFKFSVNIKQAITTSNNTTMQEGFSFLAKQYKFMGIITIIIISLYIVMMIAMMSYASSIGPRGF